MAVIDDNKLIQNPIADRTLKHNGHIKVIQSHDSNAVQTLTEGKSYRYLVDLDENIYLSALLNLKKKYSSLKLMRGSNSVLLGSFLYNACAC